MDLPHEVLEEENTTRTIPRRFGLNDVVERQIRQFREDVKKKVRITDEDVRGLFRFVIRRPDGPEVFEQVGRLLASGERSSRWIRMLPEGGRYHMARARTRRKLTKLFGRPVGGFGRPPFVIEGRALLFIEADPGGDACNLLSGFAQEVLGTTFGAGDFPYYCTPHWSSRGMIGNVTVVSKIHTVSMTAFSFTPENLVIAQGDAVTWVNDGGNHDTVSGTSGVPSGLIRYR